MLVWIWVKGVWEGKLGVCGWENLELGIARDGGGNVMGGGGGGRLLERY